MAEIILSGTFAEKGCGRTGERRASTWEVMAMIGAGGKHGVWTSSLLLQAMWRGQVFSILLVQRKDLMVV